MWQKGHLLQVVGAAWPAGLHLREKGGEEDLKELESQALSEAQQQELKHLLALQLNAPQRLLSCISLLTIPSPGSETPVGTSGSYAWVMRRLICSGRM